MCICVCICIGCIGIYVYMCNCVYVYMSMCEYMYMYRQSKNIQTYTYIHLVIGYLWSFLCNVRKSMDFHGFFLQTPCPCSNLLAAAALSARSADGLMRSSETRQPKPFMLPFNLRYSWRPDVQTFHASPGHPGYQGG